MRPRRLPVAGALALALLIPALLAAAIVTSPATILATTSEDAAVDAYAPESLPVEKAPDITAATQPAVQPATTTPETFAADATAPAIFNLTPADGSYTGSMPIIRYEYTDPSGILWPDGVHLFVGEEGRCSRGLPGTTNVTATRLTYTAAAPLPDGPLKLQAFLCDGAFNCGGVFWTINIDGTAPTVSGGQPTGVINTEATTLSALFGDGSGSGVDTGGVRVHLDGSDVSPSCSVSAAGFSCDVSGLADASHTVSVSVPDAVGNTGTGSWSFTVDTASIGITAQQPAPGSWQTSATPLLAADFQKTSTSDINTAAAIILLDGADISSAATVTANGFLYMPATPLAEGIHTVRVSVSDSTGHTGFSEWSFYTDSLAPAISNEMPQGDVNSRQPRVSAAFSDNGSGINPASARIYIDGVDESVSAAADQYGIVFTAHDDLAPGAHTAMVTVDDNTGNSQSSTWSFSTPAPPPVPLLNQPLATMASLITRQGGGWIWSPAGNSTGFGTTSVPRWNLTGFQSWPNTWYLPWYESGPGGGLPGDELIIRNQGAGEAWVTVLIGTEEKWSGKIAEGGEEIRSLENAAGGPLKVVCPTGQDLEVRQRNSGSPGGGNLAILQEDLDTTWYLPVYGAHESGDGHQGQLVIANAGEQDAEVDVFVGDPSLPDSLRSHITVSAGGASRMELPDAGSGMVKVASSNDQPLLVSQRVIGNGSLSETLGANRNTLAANLRLEEFQAGPDGAWLLVANPTPGSITIEINSGTGRLRDGDRDSFTIPAGGFIAVRLTTDARGPLTIDALNSAFGEGVVASIQTAGDGPFVEATVPPAPSE